MATAKPPKAPQDGITPEEMTRQVYAAIFTDTPSIRDNITALRTSIGWIKWTGRSDRGDRDGGRRQVHRLHALGVGFASPSCTASVCLFRTGKRLLRNARERCFGFAQHDMPPHAPRAPVCPNDHAGYQPPLV